MSNWEYTKGLHDLGNSVYAYLQPNGSWGWSNAGLVIGGEASLLVDTLYDLRLTQEMLNTMRQATSAAAHIDTVVNTHSNGDHCNGNQLVGDATIITSAHTAEEMTKEPPPHIVAQMLKIAPPDAFISKILGTFDFNGITVPSPSKVFVGELTVHVGDKEVYLIEVGPAHTLGDTLVYVPQDRVAFTGDVLFIGGHPVMWAGPTENWLRACDRILALDVETIVPGHGPITDKQGVAEVKDYLQYVYDEARKRFEAGMSAYDAARDISMDRYATWQDGERIVVNVATIYRNLQGLKERANVHAMFLQMEQFRRHEPPFE